MIIQTEIYRAIFSVVLFVISYKVVLISVDSVDDILKCDRENERRLTKTLFWCSLEKLLVKLQPFSYWSCAVLFVWCYLQDFLGCFCSVCTKLARQTLVRIIYCFSGHEPNGLEALLTAMKKEVAIHLKDQLWKFFLAFSPNDRNWNMQLLLMLSKPPCKILSIWKKP